MPYNILMEFIETTLFTKYVYSYLTDDEYLGLQSYLLQFPESGKVVPGSGGVRKLRWAMTGTGKRGTVQDWEQGRRKPSGPAKALLRIAEQKPEVFLALA